MTLLVMAGKNRIADGNASCKKTFDHNQWNDWINCAKLNTKMIQTNCKGMIKEAEAEQLSSSDPGFNSPLGDPKVQNPQR